MSLKKMGSKLARGVRQVKSQQSQRTQPDAAKSQTAPKTSPAALPAKASDPVSKPVWTRPVHRTAPSGGSLHPLRVWPD
jgi:hypothetical protein